jgi:hypothetical protein
MYVLHLAKLFFGIIKTQLCQLVFKYAEKNNIRHNFNKVKQMAAGSDWYRGFLKRNQETSLRKPEATSVNRITAFNKTEVDQYFCNLQKVMQKYNFSPDRIYNVDESGISTVPKETARRLGPRAIKQFGVIASGERGKTVTVICAISADGSYFPPLFVHPREKNGPAGTMYCCSNNGWSHEEIFLKWLHHFLTSLIKLIKMSTKVLTHYLVIIYFVQCCAIYKNYGLRGGFIERFLMLH